VIDVRDPPLATSQSQSTRVAVLYADTVQGHHAKGVSSGRNALSPSPLGHPRSKLHLVPTPLGCEPFDDDMRKKGIGKKIEKYVPYG